jgi:pheromone a factor receptor
MSSTAPGKPSYFISNPLTNGQMSSGLRAASIALPIFSIFAILIPIVPLITQFRTRNVGLCALIFYLELMNCMTFVNAIIWPNQDYANWWIGYGLCDVEVKIKAVLGTGAPCATLCITRRLARVFDEDAQVVHETRATVRRHRLVDIAICFGLPLLQMALHYLTQLNRYYLEPIGGCVTSYDNSWPTIVIFFIWPPLFSLLNCYYGSEFLTPLMLHQTLTTSSFDPTWATKVS